MPSFDKAGTRAVRAVPSIASRRRAPRRHAQDFQPYYDRRTTMIDNQNLVRISPWDPNKAIQSDDPALEPFLTFTDKDSYLTWRAEWKAEYVELSSRIRALRAVWRSQGSNHAPETHHALFTSRAVARTVLALRAASKVKAERLYQEAKAAADTALTA